MRVSDSRLLWYQNHPSMHLICDQNEDLFRDESLKLEHDNTGWQGLFLCSAFVVETVKLGLS